MASASVLARAPAARRARAGVLLVIGLWLATRIALLVLALNPALYSTGPWSDVRLYGAKAERIFQGEAPYRDVRIEYPPGSLPFTLAPALAVGTGAGYRRAFAVEMVAVDAIGLWAAWRLARRTDPGRLRIPLAYVLVMAAVGPLTLLRFDLVPAVCVLLAAMFAAEGRAGPAAAALGFGTAAKLFPAVCAPLLVLGLAPRIGWRRALLRTVPAFLVAAAVPLVPALAISVEGTVASVTYHLARGVQLESLWANGIALAHVAGGVPATVTFEFGAFDVLSPLSGGAKRLSEVVTVLALAGATLAVWMLARRRGLAPAQWAPAFALGLFAFVLPTRVLSPQYLVWLIAPAAALAGRRSGRIGLVALGVAGLLGQVIFPFRYNHLRGLEGFDVGLLTLRNLLLVMAAAATVVVLAGRGPLPVGRLRLARGRALRGQDPEATRGKLRGQDPEAPWG